MKNALILPLTFFALFAASHAEELVSSYPVPKTIAQTKTIAIHKVPSWSALPSSLDKWQKVSGKVVEQFIAGLQKSVLRVDQSTGEILVGHAFYFICLDDAETILGGYRVFPIVKGLLIRPLRVAPSEDGVRIISLQTVDMPGAGRFSGAIFIAGMTLKEGQLREGVLE